MNTPGEYSEEERRLLLQLAHEAILSKLEKREIALDPPSPHLAEARGAFTTLYRNGELRGCVGYALPISPVYRAVADTARAAAFEDSRFPPVTLAEGRDLQIELSILSPPRALAADAVEIGRARAAHHHVRTSRPAAAASGGRAPVGRDHIPAADLPQSRPAAGCVAERGDD